MSYPTNVLDQPNTWAEMLEAMAKRYINNAHERLGQSYYNALAESWPEIAGLVTGTDADPFYAEKTNDPRIERFFDVVFPYFI